MTTAAGFGICRLVILYSWATTKAAWPISSGFTRTSPDDGGFPEFLFDSAILLFKTGRLNEATSAAFQTFCSNPYWIDHLLGRPRTPLDIWHSSNLMQVEYTQALTYTSDQPDLLDFSGLAKGS